MKALEINYSHTVDKDEPIYKAQLTNGLSWYSRYEPSEIREILEKSASNEVFLVGITYSDSTPESAKHGDYDDTGWELETRAMSLTEVWDLLDREIGYFCNFQPNQNEQSLYQVDSHTVCYREGRERQLCLHVEGTTKAMRRLNQILAKSGRVA